jgi:hypothetical protein
MTTKPNYTQIQYTECVNGEKRVVSVTVPHIDLMLTDIPDPSVWYDLVRPLLIAAGFPEGSVDGLVGDLPEVKI